MKGGWGGQAEIQEIRPWQRHHDPRGWGRRATVGGKEGFTGGEVGQKCPMSRPDPDPVTQELEAMRDATLSLTFLTFRATFSCGAVVFITMCLLPLGRSDALALHTVLVVACLVLATAALVSWLTAIAAMLIDTDGTGQQSIWRKFPGLLRKSFPIGKRQS